ncbi:hypothetical protein [Bacillus phage CM1]|nr:hypothetical protein [Bacillus phage CM1]
MREKLASLVPTKLMPACGWFIIILGTLQITLFGSWAIGGIQTFTGLYILTVAVPMRMESMVRRYAIWLIFMTVVMFGAMIALIYMGQYFGALSTAFVIAGGIATIYQYYFNADKEEL